MMLTNLADGTGTKTPLESLSGRQFCALTGKTIQIDPATSMLDNNIGDVCPNDVASRAIELGGQLWPVVTRQCYIAVSDHENDPRKIGQPQTQKNTPTQI